MSDVALNADGDLPPVTRTINGDALTRQRIKVRAKTFQGEWILDTRQGLPYLQWAQQKPPRVDEIAARLAREVRTVPGVDSSSVRDSSFSIATRTVDVVLDITLVDDSPVQATVTIGTGDFGPARVVFATGT